MVYYNITPFLAELNSFTSGSQVLKQICPTIKNDTACNILTHNLMQMRDELLKENSFFSNKRSKRSPFNIVVTVSLSLFGTLDSDNLEEMAKTINDAKSEKYNFI